MNHKLYEIWKDPNKFWKLKLPKGLLSFKRKQDAVSHLNSLKKIIDIKLVSNIHWQLEEEKKKCRQSLCSLPPSHRLLKVGDRVKIGNLKWNHVLEVFDNGKFVKILTINPTIQYGRRVGTEFRIWHRLWTDCLPYRNSKDSLKISRKVENDDIKISYQQRQISSILLTYYSGSGIDLNPDYQRGNVWTDEQKYNLIKSIFRNIDIGKFTIIRRPFSKDLDSYYEMLDGKQRLTTILEFYEDRFKYNGKFFSEMHPRDQMHFKEYSISYAETEPLTDGQKYNYFLKLNVTGTPVDLKHIKKVERMLENITN